MACLSYYRSRRHRVSALFVNYGQPARSMEARAANAICRRLRVPMSTARLRNLNIPVGAIRGRNAFLLSLAFMAAEFEVGLISLGIHGGTVYPDCSEAFVKQAQRVYDVYAGGRIRIDAPFVNWSKRDVYDFALTQRLPLDLTYSCLVGRKRPCGRCESCKDVEALRAS